MLQKGGRRRDPSGCRTGSPVSVNHVLGRGNPADQKREGRLRDAGRIEEQKGGGPCTRGVGGRQ